MNATRLLVAGAIAASSLLSLPLAAAGPAKAAKKPAASIAPVKVAWFDETRATAAIPATPQVGVDKGDLLVSGVTVNPADLPALPLPGNLPVLQHITAFAALTFQIPKGATPATLTLDLTAAGITKIASKLPSGVSPEACPITSKWKAGDQQSIADAPTYNCTTLTAQGQISTDGKAIQFTGINRLIHGRTLSFVVLPGTLGIDRLVFTKPTKKTLSLLRFGSTTPLPSSSPVPNPSLPTSAGGSTAVAPSQSGSGATVPVPPVAKVSTAPNSGSSPQIANPSTTPALRAPAVTPFDRRRERLAAIALLVALVVTTLWLAATDRSGRTFATLRVLRALSSGGPLPELPATEWGIGRFKAQREGRPPLI